MNEVDLRSRPLVAVVPVAGHGTRLRPLSAYIPKELLPVGGRLALWRIAEELACAGIRRIVFVVSPEKRDFVERCFSDSQGIRPFPSGPASEMTFEYRIQPSMRGLGDAVLCAREAVGEQPFVVALGDAVYEEREPGGLLRRLIEAFVSQEATVALSVQTVAPERISRYGIVRPAAAGGETNPEVLVIDGIVEKPAPQDAPSNLAAAARYVVSPAVFAILGETPPDGRGEVQFTFALQALLEAGKKGVAVPLRSDEVRHDIGSPDSYYRAFVTLAARDPDQGPDFLAFLRRFVQENQPIDS